MRRLAVVKTANSSMRTITPAAIATGQIRFETTAQAPSSVTSTISSSEAYDLLAAQRRNRPVSPHLGIYKPQITWIGSSLNRITGCILSGGLYVFGAAYLAAPLFGWHLESASIAAAFGAWPVAAKFATKLFIAFPFTYHSFNGIRHLVWDTGAAFTNKQVIVTGYIVFAISGITALGLCFY